MEIETKKILPVAGLMLSLIALISIFLCWMSFTLLLVNMEVTGMDTIDWVLNGESYVDGLTSYVPLIVLILSILGMIVSLVQIVSKNGNRMLNVIPLIFGIAIFVLALYFCTSVDEVALYSSSQAGIGVWISMIAGLLLAVVSALPFCMKGCSCKKA